MIEKKVRKKQEMSRKKKNKKKKKCSLDLISTPLRHALLVLPIEATLALEKLTYKKKSINESSGIESNHGKPNFLDKGMVSM